MRPARIEVFDGLRIATEHVEHLQDSLHSSIHDLREAVGLGKVIRGFRVEREGAGIIVGAGLAFDGHARRLTLDEPRRVDATIPPGRDVQYVCLEHQSVEEGEVEGRPTLIWDSVAVSFQDAAPSAGDNLLAVAKLVRADAEAAAQFDVVALEARPASVTEPARASEPVVAQPEAPGVEPGPATEPAAGAEPSAATEPPPENGPAPDAGPPAAQPEDPGAEPPTAAGPAPAPRVRQGVVRLPAVNVPQLDAVAALRGALDEQREGESASETKVSISLASAEVAGGMDVAAMTCTVHLTATVSRADGTVGRLESVGQGDATFEPGALARFGLTTVRSIPPVGEVDRRGAWAATEFSEDRTAALPLAEASTDASVREVLRGLRLVTDVHVAAPDGAGVSCALSWSGPVDDRRMEALEQELAALTWSAAIGWKAVGR